MWGIPVALRYAPRRVSCPRCVGVHVESLPWVSGKQQMPHALMATLATWARVLPWQQVARLFRCSWGTVATAVEAAVAYGLAHRDLENLTHIGIDEISRKRGHVYVTNVYDLERKRLVWSGEGRSTETFHAFFDVLGPEKTAALEGICCDMWQPYIDVIKARAPQAVLVFDKFHIVRHLMEAVDQVRRDEVREKGPAHKALMYKTRFIWLQVAQWPRQSIDLDWVGDVCLATQAAVTVELSTVGFKKRLHPLEIAHCLNRKGPLQGCQNEPRPALAMSRTSACCHAVAGAWC